MRAELFFYNVSSFNIVSDVMARRLIKRFTLGICIVLVLAVAGLFLRNLLRGPLEIAVIPYGSFSEQVAGAVAAHLEETFDAKVTVLPSRKLPKAAYYPPRGRYRAAKLLNDLDSSGSYDKVIGLISEDISTTKGEHADWGIFGLGRIGGKSCVASVFRLRKDADAAKLQRRLNSVARHEVGHTLGLPHCSNNDCVMQDAKGSIKPVDRDLDFCGKCRAWVKFGGI